MYSYFILKVIILSSFLIEYGQSIKCYQCASSMDLKGEDNCGAYVSFDKEKHVSIECNTDESHMPGSFCMKLTQQGPKGFIWDGRWRQVIRRCASVAETGVTGVCNWGVHENGDYWEECYCSENECNSARNVEYSLYGTLLAMALAWLVI